jgi:hypothetical protein
MSRQAPLENLSGKDVFQIPGRVYRWADVFLWTMVRAEWEPFLERIRLTLAGANAFRAAGQRIPSRLVEEAAQEFRYAHRLETAAAMRRWLRYWRLTPERWRQAILLQAIERRLGDTEIAASSKSRQPAERLIVRWLRPLGAVSGAFQRLAEDFAGHAAIHDSLQVKQADKLSTLFVASLYERLKDSGAMFWGLGPYEIDDKAQHLLAIERSIEPYRQTLATPDAIRRQISSNPMAWTRFRYELLKFATAAAAREGADCIRFDGEAPDQVAARAGISMEQATHYYDELERPLAALLVSAATNDWIGPVEISGHHSLFRVAGKTPPRLDDAELVERIASHLFTQAMVQERRARVRWRAQF